MSEASDDLDEGTLDLFNEPPDYFKPPIPLTYETFDLDDGRQVSLRLVGENPLWAHHLWNGAKILAAYLQANSSSLVKGRAVLELGAAAGLPSLISAILGAKNVVVTDYPDSEIIENLQYNISQCIHQSSESRITALPYLWGAPVDELLLGNASSCVEKSQGYRQDDCGFETILMADLLYNHSEHQKLVRSVRQTLARKADSRALVFFTPYRPWLLDRDLEFFNLVHKSHLPVDTEYPTSNETHTDQEGHEHCHVLGVTKILQQTMDKVMFEDDRGDELLRRTVFGYEIFWADLQQP